MGMLDDASAMLDAATGGKATAKAEAEAKYKLDVLLSAPEASDVGSFGTSALGQSDNPNPLDGGITTEFIHFGFVHPDTGKKFVHKSFDPAKAETAPSGHAIMFRDALEREAIALFGFVSSTKIILKEATGSRGALEEVGAMASNLLGGGSSKPKPDPTQLDTFLTDIESAVKPINVEDIAYKDIHEAGKKLHETRAKYVQFCTNLNDFYLQPQSGSPMDMAAGAVANLPGVGNIMATVQKFAFKFLDLYLAGYLKLRETHEKSVEEAAHALTVAAITTNYQDFALTYPIWFKKAPPPEAAETPAAADDDNLLADVNKKIDEAKQKVEDVKNDVKEKVDDVYDFLGVNNSPEATPGTGKLGEIFGKLKGGETVQGAPMTASDCLIEGMDSAMKDIKGIPDFVKKVMRKINESNIGLLEDVFARIMASGNTGTIDAELLLHAGRHHLSQRIVAIMGDLASGVVPGGDFSVTNPVDGKKLSAQAFIAKLIEDKLIHYVDPIIKYAMGDLAGQMEASRKKAKENDAQTMEVMLGRLPWFTALMFKNTFFPMWNLVIEKVFETISPQIAKVVKEVNSIFEKAKDKVDTASDYANRAEDVQQQAASGVNSLDDVGKLKNSVEDESQGSKDRKAQREQMAKDKKAMEDFYKPNDKDEKFPVTKRKITGKGLKVEEDLPSVLPDEPSAGESESNSGNDNQASANNTDSNAGSDQTNNSN